MMKLIVDRFDGDFIVDELESGEIVNIPKIVAIDAKEGDIL